MTEADLRTALEGGKTLATVAKEKKVPVVDLTASLVKAGKARIAEGVKDGRLTQAQADERLKALTTRVTQLINGARPARPNHDHGFAPGGVPTGTGAATPSV